MIIVSQEKNKIINFDNIIDISITDCDKNFIISAEAIIGTDDVYIELGYYITEKRAKEILKSIYDFYSACEIYKCNSSIKNEMTLRILSTNVVPMVYVMPKQ